MELHDYFAKTPVKDVLDEYIKHCTSQGRLPDRECVKLLEAVCDLTKAAYHSGVAHGLHLDGGSSAPDSGCKAI